MYVGLGPFDLVPLRLEIGTGAHEGKVWIGVMAVGGEEGDVHGWG